MADPRRPLRTDALFDGHLERPFLAWTPSERLDWIWETMQLLHEGQRARDRRKSARRAHPVEPR